jgi:hypothetical protein
MSAHDRKKQQKLAAKKAHRADVRRQHLGEKTLMRAAAKSVTLGGVRNAMTKQSLGIKGAAKAGVDATDSLLNMDLSAVADRLGVVEESVSDGGGELYGSEPPAVA